MTLEETRLAIKKHYEQNKAGTTRAIVRVGLIYEETLRQRIVSEKLVASGNLRQSVDMQNEILQDGVRLNFYIAGYAPYVESGTRSNRRMPPINAIKDWVRVKIRPQAQFTDKARRSSKLPKLSADDRRSASQRAIDSIAWAIAKKIQKSGTKAHPFIAPVFESVEDRMIMLLWEELKKDGDIA